MYDMYTAKGGGSQCTICTVPKRTVPMYNMYSAQGEDPNVRYVSAPGEGPNVQYVHCQRGRVPMYDMYTAKGEDPNVR